MLTSAQIRAARAFLGISQSELTSLSGISISTIKKFESSDQSLQVASYRTIKKIQTAFEDKGIKFLSAKEDDGVSGVGLRYYQNKALR